MSSLPYIRSPITITRIEVWVTNRQGDFSQVRNIVARTTWVNKNIHNPRWQPLGSEEIPYNRGNTLYDEMITTYGGYGTFAREKHCFR